MHNNKPIKLLPLILLCLLVFTACSASARSLEDITAVTVERTGDLSGTDRVTIDRDAQTVSYEFSDSSVLDSEDSSYQSIALNWTDSLWDEVLANVESNDVLGWKATYTDTEIIDGIVWSVDIAFSEDESHETSTGQNAYPEQWDNFIQTLFTSIGLEA